MVLEKLYFLSNSWIFQVGKFISAHSTSPTPQFSDRIPNPPILAEIHSLTHGVFVSTGIYTFSSWYVTVLLTQGTGEVRHLGCVAVKSNLMVKSGGKPHVLFCMLPATIRSFLVYMHLSMHRNTALMKPIIKIPEAYCFLSYKNYCTKSTDVNIGASKCRIRPC